jgi:acyl carrier protein
MTFGSLSSTQQTTMRNEDFDIANVRVLIAGRLAVDVRRVTDDAHFSDDLGADWLDRLELMILIEDRFAGVEITGDDADQIEVVGDLIRYLNDSRAGLQRGAISSSGVRTLSRSATAGPIHNTQRSKSLEYSINPGIGITTTECPGFSSAPTK